MKQTRLKSKDVARDVGIELTKKDQCILKEKNNTKIISINNIPSFFYYQEKLVPTLQYLQKNVVLKKITIDMGAIKFVINGADIMRPGVTDVEDDIQPHEPIVIVDQTHEKPLSVGIALFSSDEIMDQKQGKVIKNIHYIGDDIWKFNDI